MEAYRNVNLPPEERAADLLGRMTLREKVGQLTQRLYGFACYERQGGDIRLTEEFYREADRYGGIGALYGLYRADPWSGRDFDTGLDGALAPRARNMVQRYLVEHTRLGIPALMTTECPHGHQALDGCLLPVNLASASTWSPALLEEAAKVCARQLRAMGVDLALVSALDILRDPRWGRSEECFGEDPVLAAAFAGAVVRGYRSQGVDVTAKHLCAQGETTGGVNASAARIGPRELREIHLPAVRACVEAGAASFMAAYNEIDGVYCHANPWLLRNLLREEYGFTGIVMSDGVAIDQLDAVTGDRTASGALALASGVDLGLWDTAFGHLEEAVERGLVSSARIDEAAARVLELKFRRGLFEEPYIPEDSRWQGYTPETHPQVKRLAEESVVLLKNSGRLLPLDGKKRLRVLLTGPGADDLCGQLGDYTPPVRPGGGITVRQGLERWIQAHESPVELSCRSGCLRFGRSSAHLAEAAWAAGEADVVLAVLGGTSSRFGGGAFQSNGALADQEEITMDCGENVDAGLLRLPGTQLELLRRLKAAGVEPDQIDMVMCTHLHVDHVGWNTRLENGKWVPTFRNAEYVFSRADYDHYLKLDSDPASGPVNGGSFRDSVLPVVEAGLTRMVDGAAQLDEHLKVEPAPGHTPGTIAIQFDSRGEKALFCGDILHHALQVYHPEWNSFACADGVGARKSRRAALEYCAGNGARLMPCHFGAPFSCHIDHKGDGFVPRFGGQF
jgi:beta-glucosidase